MVMASPQVNTEEHRVGRLLLALREGNCSHAEFRIIYERYYRRIEGFFIRKGYSREERRDLIQDTFIRVYRKGHSFRGEDEPQFIGWLLMVARNIHKNEIRYRRAQKRAAQETSLEEAVDSASELVEPGPGGQPAEDPARRLLDEEEKRLLKHAIEQLPPKMQSCVVLRTYHCLKLREIADVQAISVETVKAHLHQARRRLKQELGERFEGLG